MNRDTKMRLQSLGVLLAILAGFVVTFYLALRAESEAPTVWETDNATIRDLEIESMRARIEDLEADLAAREDELEHLAQTLNGAIADRNEAIAILRATGELPCRWWQEAGGVPTEHAEDTETEEGRER